MTDPAHAMIMQRKYYFTDFVRTGLGFLVVVVVATGGLITAADERPLATGGEMPSAVDRIAAWAAQSGAAPADRPWISGVMTWRGRADRAYKPFQQWEMRLASEIAVSDLALRVRALDGSLKPMAGGDSGWRAVGALAAKGQRQMAVKLNCSLPALYEIDLTWKGGAITLQGVGDQLPVPKDEANAGPRLFAVMTNFDYDGRNKIAKVEFTLRNLGATAATGVSVIASFRKDDGSEVASMTQQVKKSVAPGEALELAMTCPKVPAFATVRLVTRTAQGGDPVAGKLSDASEIQLGNLRRDGTQLKAVVRNGLATAVMNLVVDLELRSATGAVIRKLAFPSLNLAAGAQSEVELEVGKSMPAWASFSTGFGYDN